MDKIKELEEKINKSSGEDKIEYLNDLAFALYVSDPVKTESYAKKALELATQLKSKPDIARSYNIIGISYHRRGNYNEALKYYNKALVIFRQLNITGKIAAIQNNIGGIYEKLGNYDNALKYYLRSLKIWSETDDKGYVAASYNNIGIIYEKQENFDEALKYHFKSLKIKEELEAERDVAISLNNIGIVYEKQKKHDLALEYLLKSLEMKERSGDKHSIAVSYINVGNIYGDMGEHDIALSYFDKSSQLFNELNDPYGDVTAFTSMGIILARQHKFDQAYEYLKKALDTSCELKAKGLEMNSLDALYILFEIQQDFKQALFYHKKLSDVKDEIFNDQKSKQIAEMRTKYETEQKERETEIFRLKNAELATANEMVHVKNIKLEEREKELKLINKILRHDIINNLSVINAAINIYKDQKDEDALDEALDKVKKSTTLIRKMQERENLISSEDLKAVNILDIIQKIITHYPDVDFTIKGEGTILADSSIDSVIDNIINNAVIHSGTNKIDITVTSDNDECTATISDFGSGIPDDIKDKIFYEGFTHGEKGNTGIGLYIVRESIKRWGGKISVEDNKPKGTTFTLSLKKT